MISGDELSSIEISIILKNLFIYKILKIRNLFLAKAKAK